MSIELSEFLRLFTSELLRSCMRLFTISFKYCLVLSRYSLNDVLYLVTITFIFDIVVNIKVTDPYSFVITLFFSFLFWLKKVLMSLISLSLITSFSFKTRKKFPPSLIMSSSNYFSYFLYECFGFLRSFPTLYTLVGFYSLRLCLF